MVSLTSQESSLAREQQFLQEIDMPPLSASPEERLQQLMATRNEWKLYHRTCDATAEKILSAYPADSPYKVYKEAYPCVSPGKFERAKAVERERKKMMQER